MMPGTPFSSKPSRLPHVYEGEVGGGIGRALLRVFGKSGGDVIRCSVEDVLEAYRIELSQPLTRGSDLFSYFAIMTKFGVWDYGKNIIKDIHFELRFISLNNNLPDVKIDEITPNDTTREVGTKTKTNLEQSGRAYSVSPNVKAGADMSLLKANLNTEVI